MSICLRYLTLHYLKNIFVISSFTIFLALSFKLEYLSKLIGSGFPIHLAGKLFLSFLPLVFSFTFPIGSLASAFLISSRMSQEGELTALRSSGISPWRLIAPFLIVGFFSTLIITYTSSQWETSCHTLRSKILKELYKTQPLSLLSQRNAFSGTSILINPLSQQLKDNESLIFLHGAKRLALYLLSPLERHSHSFKSQHATFLTTTKEAGSAPSLIVENAQDLTFEIKGFESQFPLNLNLFKSDYLPYAQLKLYKDYLNQKIASESDLKQKQIYIMKRKIAFSEGWRRFSLGLLSFTMTLLGFVKGLFFTRSFPKKRFIFLLCTCVLCFLSYFVAHQVEHLIGLSLFFYFVPQSLVILYCFYDMNQFSKGEICF